MLKYFDEFLNNSKKIIFEKDATTFVFKDRKKLKSLINSFSLDIIKDGKIFAINFDSVTILKSQKN